MIRIKVTTTFPYSPIIRQTPGSSGRFGDCQFLVDNDDPACDVWVIYGPLREPVTALCPAGNTILVDDEPPDVRVYTPAYTAQFNLVIGCQPQIDHPNVLCQQQGHPWHVGVNRQSETTTLDYDALKAMSHIDKPRLLSVVCSSKSATPGHRLRLKFLDHLRDHFGSEIDVFGRGFLPVGDKWQAVAPYKYHIAMENSCVPHYISEKLTDSYVAGAYPLYHGCPNVDEYFSPQAYTPIDIREPLSAIATIRQAIEDDLYHKRLKAIWEARALALDKYNFFAALARVCRAMPIGRRRRITINPEWVFRAEHSLLGRIKTKAHRVLAQLVPPVSRAA